MHDYDPADNGYPSGLWHSVQKVLDDNDRPSAANFALAGSEPDMNRFLYLKSRGMPGGTAGIAISSGVVTPGGGFSVGVEELGPSWVDFPTAAGLTPYAQFNSCAIGDQIIVTFTAAFTVTGTQDFALLKLQAVQDYGGVGLSTQVPGAIATVQKHTDGTISTPVHYVTLVGGITITTPGALRVKLMGQNQGGGGSSDKIGILHGHYYTLRLERVRPFTP